MVCSKNMLAPLKIRAPTSRHPPHAGLDAKCAGSSKNARAHHLPPHTCGF